MVSPSASTIVFTRAARAFGLSQPAIDRFLHIINDRRHLPVRIMDSAIHVYHLIQIIRCEMDDVQFYTLHEPGIPYPQCWLGEFSYFEGGEGGDAAQDGRYSSGIDSASAELETCGAFSG